MLILTKAILALMLGFIISAVLGLILIPLLKRINMRQNISVFLNLENHTKKNGVPTMGGLIFIIPTLITMGILVITNKVHVSYNLLLVIAVFVAYAILGFIDDYLSIKRKNNEGLTVKQKLFGQILIAILFYIIFRRAGNDSILDLHTIGITIDLGVFYALYVLLVMVATTNAVNVTDGLDGLAGGLSAIAMLAFGIISWGSTWIAYNQDIAIFCFILVGTLFGYLLFNTHPAKVIMGDTGSLALGAALASVALITDHDLTLIVVSGVFVVETLSVLIQSVSIVYFKRKIFLMTPLHHHFEKMGWQENDIVKLFWSIGLVLSMAAIIFGVWI